MSQNQMLFKLALVGWASVGLMAEDNHAQPAPVSKTERTDFPSGGMLRIDKSFGDLTIEGWDRPDTEITWIKKFPLDYRSTPSKNAVRELDQVHITAERRGDEIVITTAVPKAPRLARPFRGLSRFALEYRIKAPRNARLTIDHQEGEVHVDNIAGDLHITDRAGQITVSLPSEGHYAIDAKAKLGAIDSDFEGHEQRKHKFGHAFTSEPSSAPQKLSLRVGFGDITILNSSRPPAPPALTQK